MVFEVIQSFRHRGTDGAGEVRIVPENKLYLKLQKKTNAESLNTNYISNELTL